MIVDTHAHIYSPDETAYPVIEKPYRTAVKFHLDSGLIRKAPAFADVIPEAFRN